jgi:hypothetical protein
MNADDLVGETLAYIDVDPDGYQILLTTESGRKIKIYHDQNCCESVQIIGTDGEWRSVIGKPLVLVEHNEHQGDGPPYDDAESWTYTDLVFRVNDATVISKWVGESNGYYSESVDLCEIT